MANGFDRFIAGPPVGRLAAFGEMDAGQRAVLVLRRAGSPPGRPMEPGGRPRLTSIHSAGRWHTQGAADLPLSGRGAWNGPTDRRLGEQAAEVQRSCSMPRETPRHGRSQVRSGYVPGGRNRHNRAVIGAGESSLWASVQSRRHDAGAACGRREFISWDLKRPPGCRSVAIRRRSGRFNGSDASIQPGRGS